jgi:CRISPR system Cascade subunit CasE
VIEQAWFTRLTLRRDSAAVAPLIDVLAPKDGGQSMTTTHRLMWSIMPEHIRHRWDRASPEHEVGGAFLWREAAAGRKFYLLGPRPVAESPYFAIETKPFEPRLAAGDQLAFDLRVNATVARKVGVTGEGVPIRKRVDVTMDRMVAEEHKARDEVTPRAQRRERTAEVAARDWLDRQGERNGFRVIASRLASYRVEILPRRGDSARIGVCELRGLVEVVDADEFLKRLLKGFGHAKAFGCGLMLIRRP